MDFPRTVYAIRHNKTDRVYIGSSKKPAKRYEAHIFALRKGKHPVEDMQSDFDLYGEDYTVELLEVITDYENRMHEYDWMEKYNSHIRGCGYNYKDWNNQMRVRTKRVWTPNKERLASRVRDLTDEEAKTLLAFLDAHEQNRDDPYITEIVSLLRKNNDFSLVDFILHILKKAVQE